MKCPPWFFEEWPVEEIDEFDEETYAEEDEVESEEDDDEDDDEDE